MKNTYTKKPIDLLIEFETYCKELQPLHSDHYYRMLNVYGICKTASLICENDYTAPLKEAFPSNEAVTVFIQAVTLANNYWHDNKTLLVTAYAFIEQVKNEPDKATRILLRKNAGAAFSQDALLQEVVANVKGVCLGVMTKLKSLKGTMQVALKTHPLLQPMAQ